MTGRGPMALAAAIFLMACGRPSTNARDVASLRLTCSPAISNVRCRVLALFRDVSQPPRDVTATAVWHVSGVAGARMMVDGFLTTPPSGEGDVDVEAEYATHRARVHVHVTGMGPGQMLASLRGHVYVETERAFQPVSLANLEAIGGSSRGRTATTEADGSYEFVLMPGDVVIRATKLGYSSAEASLEMLPGENRLSLLIEPLPQTTIAGRSRGEVFQPIVAEARRKAMEGAGSSPQNVVRVRRRPPSVSNRAVPRTLDHANQPAP